MSNINIFYILLASGVMTRTEAACGQTYSLGAGETATVEHTYDGGKKCINKVQCNGGGFVCDMTITCSEFSFPSGNKCKKPFLQVKDGRANYGKHCDATGAPDMEISSVSLLKFIAKGKKSYNYRCQITVKPDDSDNLGGNGDTSCCATYNPSDVRIVGGVAVQQGEFPWQASLKYKSGGSHFCGGTLISASWVLTAKHCVDGANKNTIKVSLGEHRLSQSDGERDYNVNQIKFGTGNYRFNDIALLKLSTKAIFSDSVKPACLPSAGDTFNGKSLWTSGWGHTTSGGTSSNVLLKVYVPVVSQQSCRQSYGSNNVGDNEICAGRQGKDSCQGDSGGPAVYTDGPDKRAVIVGVTSWGEGCGLANKPGVYVRVTSYLSWIKSTISGDGICSA